MTLFRAAHACLRARDPAEKLALTRQVAEAFARGELAINGETEGPEPIGEPGRPERPRLVSPRELPRRGLGSVAGRAAFLHAIAHIEFNAVNLAWDAVYRFRGLPPAFYADWVGVAADEARHFQALETRLNALGAAYGDFDGHDGLWRMGVVTADCLRARMALVPRVLEARGLDVTPGMIERLDALGDRDSVEVLAMILREEIAHVAAGSRWFVWCCRRDGLVPREEFLRLIGERAPGVVRGPFNVAARRQAGFSSDDLDVLDALAREPKA